MTRTLTAALIALLTCGQATAAFYVDDDAPQQVAVAARPSTTTKVIDLTFSARRAWMGPAVRRGLADQQQLLVNADEISIVAPSAAPNNSTLANQRMDGIKQWLMDNGISRARIVTGLDAEPRPRDLNDVVTVTITARAMPATAAVAPARAITASLIRPAPPPAYVAPQPPAAVPGQFDPVTKLALLQRIVAMGKNKIVPPDQAFNLIAEVLAMQDLAPPAQAAPQAAPTAAALFAPDLPRQWNLDGSKTLRANLDDWARIAGFEPVSWRATGQYSVGDAHLNGTFYQVLGDLSKAVTVLDFSLNKARRTLVVSDPQ